jgi:response regulator RpfG family c-di-GMP phosphodiesterase
MSKLKVLIVDDTAKTCERLKDKLGKKVDFLYSDTIEQAEVFFDETPDVDAIIISYNITNDKLNLFLLIQKFKEFFSGPIIAMPSHHEDELIKAGCSYKVGYLQTLDEALIEIFHL